jgi:hypothetical protein
MKKEFIKKWSNFWAFQPQHDELDNAFEKELDAIIRLEIAQVIQGKVTSKEPE